MAKAKKSAPKKVAKSTRKPAAKKPASNRPSPAPAHTLTPYLAVNDAAAALEWYKKAFGAKVVTTQPAFPGSSKLMHAALRIGDSDLFLSDIFPGSDAVDPTKTGPSVTLHVWSKDADKLWKGAVANGAKVTMPIDDMFWGDRYGKLLDPFGHSWSISTKSKLSAAALEEKRVAAMAQFASM